jgi:methionine synthase II (cobalamin-independent)
LITGIHPLSESLIKNIFDFKYGRVTSVDLIRKAFKQDIEDLIDIQKQIFPLAVSTGNLGWWDIYRPFTEKVEGLNNQVAIGDLPVVRNPLTNTFFRQLIVTGKLFSDNPILKMAQHNFLEGNLLQTHFLPEKFKQNGWCLCLPGPFSLSRASIISPEAKTDYTTNDDLIIDFTTILVKELQYLSSKGFSHVVIDESAIAYENLNKDLMSIIIDSWNRLVTGSTLKIIIHTHRHLSEMVIDSLIESKAWGIGVDFINNDPSEFTEKEIKNKTLVAGVVDSHGYFRNQEGNAIVEETNDITELCRKLMLLQPQNIILAPTTRLEFIPRSVADLKLDQLGRAVKLLQKNGGM